VRGSQETYLNINKRHVNIILTDKGREVLMQAMPIATEIVKQLMSSITEDAVIKLEKSLRVLRQNTHYAL
jgi:DNA-binding MarR family transcriptional regulator